jgi:apolipoprotein D and lipocalin family protein
MTSRASLLALLFVTCPHTVAAAAPAPAKPVPASLYSGRWYEIARTPNTLQRNCEGATSEFEDFSGAGFEVVDTCHADTPDGPAKVLRAKARMVAGSENTRFRMGFFGGLVRQEYWILDYATDGAWAIMATPGGNYVWLLARRPVLPTSVMAAAMARVHQLGYARLVFPRQLG